MHDRFPSWPILLSGLLLATASFVQGQASQITFQLQDESGFPPASALGFGSLPGLPMALYALDGSLGDDGLTNASGFVTLDVTAGYYLLQCAGGPMQGGVIGSPYLDRPLWLDAADHFLLVHLPWIDRYHFATGRPFDFVFMDLDVERSGHQRAITVAPGATVSARVRFKELPTVNTPVWYVSLFGSWQPTSPLANLASGTAGPGRRVVHTVEASFTAPASPGLYRVRLLGVLDFTWPPSYYTGLHYEPSLGRDMGVVMLGSRDYSDYGEGTITVVAP